MADRPLLDTLPADLPEDWTSGQIVAPYGADVGLSQQHGYNYLMEQVNAVQRAANAINESFDTISGKRTCRVTIGTSTAGWTQADCDYLCDGTDDQEELNAAIQAVFAQGGGEIAVLGGEYNLSAAWDIENTTGKEISLTFSGEPGASVLNLASDIWMGSSTRASLRFFGLTFSGGGVPRRVGSQNTQIGFEACVFLNIWLDLSAYNDTRILFRRNEMLISTNTRPDVNTNCPLVVASLSNAGALVEGNSIRITAAEVNAFGRIINLDSRPYENSTTAGIIFANNAISVDNADEANTLTIAAQSCCVVNNGIVGASIDAQYHVVCAGNLMENGSIYASLRSMINGNRVKNGSIYALDNSVVIGNVIAAPSDAAAIIAYKYGGNDIPADRTPSITGNIITSGTVGIHLQPGNTSDNIDKSQTGALVSGNRIWGCETPIQIDDNWGRCMVTGNMFPAGSAIVDQGTDNIVRLNSDDPGDGSGGGGGAAGVSSFKGRTGAVVPQSGDYTAAMVGAVASGAVQAVQLVTEAEYDALTTKNTSTLYLIKE